MAGKPIRAKLLEYAQSHSGELMFAHKIAEDLGETLVRVRKGLMNTLEIIPDSGLERLATDVWRFTPPLVIATSPTGEAVPAPAEEMTPPPQLAALLRMTEPEPEPMPLGEVLFRQLAILADGSLIIEADDGRPFRAVPL